MGDATLADHPERYLAAALAIGLAACAPSKLAFGQVKSALTEAGLSDSTATCMAGRMTDKLSLGQLVKLKKLKGANRSLGEFVDAVRKVGDLEALQVTVSSAALCSTGLAG
jgi:hypothetical protein